MGNANNFLTEDGCNHHCGVEDGSGDMEDEITAGQFDKI